ncbi:hypothetical protein C1645_829909 [Glomus cerebriforme]|uniref:Tc1-like transposase DDE domain-containing protein n=1 Tax=Glomus cerebriforme TaxID=658196 RepID=A0A397SK50_9GLOM|nr:hypothetical protein C1645_829909 [Glomus cerebriforme]
MDAKFYVKILENYILEIDAILGDGWRLQQDNDLKHTSHFAREFLLNNILKLNYDSNNNNVRIDNRIDNLELDNNNDINSIDMGNYKYLDRQVLNINLENYKGTRSGDIR